ncbi:type II secretion system protein [Persephonella sp.]
MNRKGFTLIELAIVLIIIGLLLGIGITVFSLLIKRAKISSTKEAVNAAVESVLGYTFSAGKLPDSTQFSQIVREKKDAFGKDLVYIYDEGLTDYCGRTSTHITIEVCSDTACTTPVQTVENVAFIVLSSSANYNNQTAGSQAVNSDTTIRVYEYGVEVDNYAGDFSRVEPYDDIVKWVTLSELHNSESCRPVRFPQNINLPTAVEDTPYSTRITVTGGKPPYTFGSWNGSSCDTGTRWSGYGLSLTEDGYITGTVNYDTDSNTGSVTGCSGEIQIDNLCVVDSLGDYARPSVAPVIKVLPQKVQILTDILPPAYEGSDYNVEFAVIGGGDSYSWNLDGSLPSSLTFSNGQISGTVDSDSGCSNPSPYSFTVSAESCGMTAVKGFSLTVIDPDCNSLGGGSGGGGGSCSSISIFNTGNLRYVKTGYVFLFWCIETSGCITYSNGSSVTLNSGDCMNVYTRSNCRRRETVVDYNTAYSVDTNTNCEVNYNNGTLSDR